MAARGGLTVYVNFCCWLQADNGRLTLRGPLPACYQTLARSDRRDHPFFRPRFLGFVPSPIFLAISLRWAA